jgi:hypothetical protein
MYDEGVVLGKLDPEREGRKPPPIILFELVGHPLVGGPEDGKLVTGALGIPPRQAMLIVVSAHRERPHLPHQPNNAERIRPLGHQISDQHQLVPFFPTRLLEQVLQLLAAAVDVSYDEGTGAHVLILGA